MALLVFLVSLAPGLVYLWLVYRLDRYEPEPRGWVALVFFLGMAAVVPLTAGSALVERLHAPFLGPEVEPAVAALRYLVVVAPIEEGLKILAFLPAFLNRRLFNEPVDGLVYAAAASLGFASLENALYALEWGAELLVWRALLAVPMHLVAGAVWGLGLAYVRLVRGGARGRLVAGAAVLAAVVVHGAYDILVDAGGRLSAAALLAAVAAALWLPLRALRKRSPFRSSILPPGEAKLLAACPSCGGAGRVGERCPRCEVRLAPLFYDGPAEPPLHLGWTLGAVAVLAAGAAGVALLVPVVGGRASLLVAGAFVLVGSVAVGRISPGVTIAEPAVAGAAATIVYLLLVGGRLGAALVLSPVGLVLAVLGAWLGEAWQGRGRRRSRAARPEAEDG